MPRNRRRTTRSHATKGQVKNAGYSSSSSDSEQPDLESVDLPDVTKDVTPDFGGVDFFPSAKFSGPKRGYIFKNDENGLGYYIDTISTTEVYDKGAKMVSRHSKSAASYDPRFALPTTSEMQQLRQADGTTNGDKKLSRTKSNLTELKFESLLKHVSVNYDDLKDLEKSLFKLKQRLDGIEPFILSEQSSVYKKIKGLHPLW